MKKPTRRDARPGLPLQALDRQALERVSAGHKSVDPMAGMFQNFQPAGSSDSSGD
jgi:hypothetical protein